jgi:hypothetical protein
MRNRATYRHLIAGDLLVGEDQELNITLTHCPARLWGPYGTLRDWLVSFHREEGYTHVCLLGFELSIIKRGEHGT